MLLPCGHSKPTPDIMLTIAAMKELGRTFTGICTPPETHTGVTELGRASCFNSQLVSCKASS